MMVLMAIVIGRWTAQSKGGNLEGKLAIREDRSRAWTARTARKKSRRKETHIVGLNLTGLAAW